MAARDAFRREVNVSLALGPDVELPVTDSDGGHPAVVALEVCEIRLRAT